MTGAAMDGWPVLVPHGGEWGDRVAGLLAEHGARATVVPLIEFSPPSDVAALDAALMRLAQGAYAWVTITSGTTVTALAGRAAALVDPAFPAASTPATALAAVLGRTRVAAVGPGTARVLERHGVTVDLLPSGERSARGLVAQFPPPDFTALSHDPGAPSHAPGAPPHDPTALPRVPAAAGSRVLCPHSDLAEPTVTDGLRAAGWEVDDVIAYRTVSGPVPSQELREDVRAGVFRAVLLSSTSTVTNLLELVGTPPRRTLVCCIGPRTVRAAVAAGLTVDVVPDVASAPALVEALAAYARDHDHRTPDGHAAGRTTDPEQRRPHEQHQPRPPEDA